jgi:hypothetical protein
MNTYLVIAVTLVLVLGYLYLAESESSRKPKPKLKRKVLRKPRVSALKNRYIYIRQTCDPNSPSTEQAYVAINKLTRFLYLVSSVNKAEIFTLDKFPEENKQKDKSTNKIYIKSMDNFYINLKYSISHKKEYDVVAGNEYLSNLSKLRLLKDSTGYYIEFFNGHYLCINNGLLFCCKDPAKIFYFNFIVKNNHGKVKIVD